MYNSAILTGQLIKNIRVAFVLCIMHQWSLMYVYEAMPTVHTKHASYYNQLSKFY